jgi:hypothetical protein
MTPLVVQAIGTRIDPNSYLPREPAMLWAVTNQLYPVSGSPQPGRRALLESIIQAQQAAPAAGDAVAVAEALVELGRFTEAEEQYREAFARYPDDEGVRDGWARWLEAEERYEEALPHLQWLSERRRNDRRIRDRVTAAQHARALQRIIEGR